MADMDPEAIVRVVKVTATIAADANIPGLLKPYQGIGTGPGGSDEPCWLDMAGGHSQVHFTVNGVPKLSGNSSTFTFYPGTTITNGDVKCNAALSAGDIIVIRYAKVAYIEIGS